MVLFINLHLTIFMFLKVCQVTFKKTLFPQNSNKSQPKFKPQ